MRKIYQQAMAVAMAVTTLIGIGIWRKSVVPTPVAKKAVEQNTSAAATGISEATLADIRKSLEKQEYHISYDEQKKKLQSPNRSNNIRAYYEPGKLTVQTRVDTTGDGFKVELVNEGIFADGKLLYTPEADARADHHDNKVQIRHDAFTEEFINNEDGVRQNFIVKNAPDGTRQLQVKMTANGLKVTQGSGNELRFFSETPDGQTRNELVYSDLKCWDANKQPLNATLAYVDNHIQISVEVTGASYPVTIDPIIANGTPLNANKILEIHQSYMHLGFSVSSAGDVNGDGYSDVIVGAPDYDKGQDNEGGAFVYKGDPSGLTLTAVTFESNQKDAHMGYSVASAGDFNGDGFSDVLVGIPYYDKDAIDEGRANLYLGSGTFFTSPITAYGIGKGDGGALFGINVATAGDVDGNGLSDVLIGASQDPSGGNKAGSVAIYYGNANGAPQSFKTISLNQANAQFGYSIAPAGDIDADGYGDIIVGARYYTNGQGQDAEGAAFIYRGSSAGILGNPTIIEGDQYDAGMGNKVSSAGDVNGDGYSDILISAYVYDGPNLKDQGIVNLHLGSSTGITAQPVRTFEGGHIDDRMGSSIACAGDVNGDGYSDILIGAQHYDNGQFNEGAVFLYQGSKDGIVGSYASLFESNQADGWFGTAVSSAGDVNGDGFSDILIGCYTYDNGQTDEGHVFAYYGGAEGVGIQSSIVLSPNTSGSKMGLSAASAGDVNGDGFNDIIVGAPYYSHPENEEGIAILYYGSSSGVDFNNKTILEADQANAHFGTSVAGAGDINGDGFDDVIIGAAQYDKLQINEGAVLVHYGSSGGISITSSAILENNIAGSHFGYSVSGAGDVNRDGYADVIIGVEFFTNTEQNEGAAYVFNGSMGGLGNPKILEINQPEAFFGRSVSGAGDVNGDGYSDVIVGATNYDLGESNEGAAFVYHGASGGIVENTVISLQGNQIDAYMGSAVSDAGDVNGDGYGDVIVGASHFDNGQSNEGIARVHYGSITGITNNSPTLLESNKIGARFGMSVRSAGDVNGDGYSDVIIGAPYFNNGQIDEGAAFAYHGSPTGAKTTSAFTVEGNEINAKMGSSVSAAFDVNGDGYSDVLVGIPDYDNLQYLNAGGLGVFYGNNGKGLRNNVRLYNSGLAGPYDHNQFILQNFGLGLFAKSFIGRNKARLVWETRANGNAFSKVDPNPITTSTQFTGEITNLTNLPMTGAERLVILDKTGATTRVRVRVRYSPVLAITGQMYGPWRYVQRQLAGFNNAPVPEEAMAETIKRKAEPEIGTSVSLFPNPASDRLSIQVADPSDIRAVRLYNTSGTPVFQSQRYEKNIDVSKFPGGVYILMLNRASGTPTSHRILIRR